MLRNVTKTTRYSKVLRHALILVAVIAMLTGMAATAPIASAETEWHPNAEELGYLVEAAAKRVCLPKGIPFFPHKSAFLLEVLDRVVGEELAEGSVEALTWIQRDAIALGCVKNLYEFYPPALVWLAGGALVAVGENEIEAAADGLLSWSVQLNTTPLPGTVAKIEWVQNERSTSISGEQSVWEAEKVFPNIQPGGATLYCFGQLQKGPVGRPEAGGGVHGGTDCRNNEKAGELGGMSSVLENLEEPKSLELELEGNPLPVYQAVATYNNGKTASDWAYLPNKMERYEYGKLCTKAEELAGECNKPNHPAAPHCTEWREVPGIVPWQEERPPPEVGTNSGPTSDRKLQGGVEWKATLFKLNCAVKFDAETGHETAGVAAGVFVKESIAEWAPATEAIYNCVSTSVRCETPTKRKHVLNPGEVTNPDCLSEVLELKALCALPEPPKCLREVLESLTSCFHVKIPCVLCFKLAAFGADVSGIEAPGIKLPAFKGELCRNFPLGVPCWLWKAIEAWSATGEAPSLGWEEIHSGVVKIPAESVSLSPLESAMEIIRPFLVVFGTIGVVLLFYRLATGGSPSSGSQGDHKIGPGEEE